ncbi:H-NS histone family protein [Salibaculum griseiflavum]|jgi:DNA-binding protein H-NS|uniref:DNA-binding protein n=1 Tax=Salibaculum griseiflavum TaxID=1914409 RepID=A0A2V1P736_9RHOB|nr:H-NS histone family protein [Salibaculum griseiflavum]PWG17634.1 DNA-binding protein [Salibaculum griseiflavum]
MSTDLKTMTRKELEKLRRDVDKQIERLKKQDLKKAREAAEKAAASLGFSLDEVIGDGGKKPRASRGKAKSAGAPKYANPENPSQTWTGKGRQPQWYKDAIAAGKSPESMEL